MCHAMLTHAMLCYAVSCYAELCWPVCCRYRRLYNAAIKDRAVTYAWFFLFYLIHIAFCIWSAVSPPLPGANDWSHTGFIACIKAFHASKFVGVLYTIGGVFWALESLWSFWVLKTVRGCLACATALTTQAPTCLCAVDVCCRCLCLLLTRHRLLLPALKAQCFPSHGHLSKWADSSLVFRMQMCC